MIGKFCRSGTGHTGSVLLLLNTASATIAPTCPPVTLALTFHTPAQPSYLCAHTCYAAPENHPACAVYFANLAACDLKMEGRAADAARACR